MFRIEMEKINARTGKSEGTKEMRLDPVRGIILIELLQKKQELEELNKIGELVEKVGSILGKTGTEQHKEFVKSREEQLQMLKEVNELIEEIIEL